MLSIFLREAQLSPVNYQAHTFHSRRIFLAFRRCAFINSRAHIHLILSPHRATRLKFKARSRRLPLTFALSRCSNPVLGNRKTKSKTKSLPGLHFHFRSKSVSHDFGLISIRRPAARSTKSISESIKKSGTKCSASLSRRRTLNFRF